MKRILSITLTLLLVLSLAACGGGGSNATNDIPQDQNQGAGGAPVTTPSDTTDTPEPEDQTPSEDTLPAESDGWTLTTIDGEVFYGLVTWEGDWERLSEVTASKDAAYTYLDSYTGTGFMGAANLKTVSVEADVVLGDQTFAECRNLESVSLTGTVASGGNGTFALCDSLQTVVLGNVTGEFLLEMIVAEREDSNSVDITILGDFDDYGCCYSSLIGLFANDWGREITLHAHAGTIVEQAAADIEQQTGLNGATFVLLEN